MSGDASLHSRLRNCLQTILDLNESINSPVLARAFMQELELIRKFLRHLDVVELQEEDVLRIERATGIFLNELRGLSADGSPAKAAGAGGTEGTGSGTPPRLQ